MKNKARAKMTSLAQTDFKGLRLRSVQGTISPWNPRRVLNCIAGVLKKIDKWGKPAVERSGRVVVSLAPLARQMLYSFT